MSHWVRREIFGVIPRGIDVRPFKQVITMSNSDLQNWIVSHNSDYGCVIDRLATVRNVVLRGRLDAAADILERAYMFGVLSIRTDRDRHEQAFTAYYSGNIPRAKAAQQTVYGWRKSDWIARTFDRVDWENLALVVRSHVRNDRYAELLDAIDDNLVGVAHRKGAFMLAMSGLWEFMCIDSNVARHAGIDESEGNALEFSSADEYFEMCDEIVDETGIGGRLPPFVIQWAIYDYERGEHARHMAYFNEVLK